MRPHVEETWMAVSDIISLRSTCIRRKVGCVLVNARGHVLATGYNGVAAGATHCTDSPCPGSRYPSGHGLAVCAAIHAEQNALLQCPDVHQIDRAYMTDSPCMHCVKLLLNTSCKRIIYRRNYNDEALLMWSDAGREFKQYE